MNNDSKLKDDLLRQYIRPGKIEEAPEGFTSKVMFRIGSEASPVTVKEYFWKKNLIPVISVIVTLVLIIFAFLIPENHAETALPVINLLKNIKLSLPKVDFQTFPSLNLPSVTIYAIIGIACLTVFDKALSGIFKRR